jgi:hypothetical protein
LLLKGWLFKKTIEIDICLILVGSYEDYVHARARRKGLFFIHLGTRNEADTEEAVGDGTGFKRMAMKPGIGNLQKWRQALLSGSQKDREDR